MRRRHKGCSRCNSKARPRQSKTPKRNTKRPHSKCRRRLSGARLGRFPGGTRGGPATLFVTHLHVPFRCVLFHLEPRARHYHHHPRVSPQEAPRRHVSAQPWPPASSPHPSSVRASSRLILFDSFFLSACACSRRRLFALGRPVTSPSDSRSRPKLTLSPARPPLPISASR